MAAGPLTQISDVIVPSVFSPYVQVLTEEKSSLIRSGALVRDARLARNLAGGGLTFNEPFFKDLDDDDARVSTDSIYAGYSGGTADPDPKKIETGQEIQVRLNRNQSWSSADLTAQLAGADPMNAIANRVAEYWARQLQKAWLATWKGVIANNTSADSGDYTNDISDADGAGVYSPGITTFSAEAVLDTLLTMGDSQDDLAMVMMHSVVLNRAQKQDLIDFRRDSEFGPRMPFYMGKPVLVNDNIPQTAGVYDTWFFGAGATAFGASPPPVPTEMERHPGSGNGSGSDVLYNRVQWCIHPVGHAYIGTSPNGGPDNTANTHMLAAAGSWDRRFPERKQIKFARLVTREHG